MPVCPVIKNVTQYGKSILTCPGGSGMIGFKYETC